MLVLIYKNNLDHLLNHIFNYFVFRFGGVFPSFNIYFVFPIQLVVIPDDHSVASLQS